MDPKQKHQIEEYAKEEAGKLGLVILHSNFRGSSQRPIIEITLDGDRAILVEDCEKVSKSILQFIDNLVNNAVNYRLDVLSPGIDEPLNYDFQLRRSLEKTIAVKYRAGESIVEKKGKLVHYDDFQIGILETAASSRSGKSKDERVTTIARADISSMNQVAVIR
ncbi:MAG TPA: hypothetical protein VEW28_06300 [Candidatus Kapabacteria bacterium]|nr:hypothetical protein [Candidatus Kapabacteria bacterium]